MAFFRLRCADFYAFPDLLAVGRSSPCRADFPPNGGSAPAQIKAIRFELLDVSRDPGVCLNSPLDATDRNPDLKLAPDPECSGTASAGDQQLEVTRPLGEAVRALGRIESFDFGARATLRVTCGLLDGRQLVGELKDDGGEAATDLIRLPKIGSRSRATASMYCAAMSCQPQ